MTNYERIKAMGVEEMGKCLMQANDCGLHIPFCSSKPECLDDLEMGYIPEEKCVGCMLEWLMQEIAE